MPASEQPRTQGAVTKALPWMLAGMFAIVCLVLTWQWSLLRFKEVLAASHVATFRELTELARASVDPHELCGFLEYARDYYPSGTQQARGSPLGRIVESVRSDTMREIVDLLRGVSGRDLGTDPNSWLAAYPPSAPWPD